MTQDARYDRYADIFENPDTAESIELGNRVMHWLFTESWAPASTVYQRLKEA